MKRKTNTKVGESKKSKQSRPVSSQATTDGQLIGVGADHPAWTILINNLDVCSQMKISQLNQRLFDIVEENAQFKLRKFRRQIQNDKYM